MLVNLRFSVEGVPELDRRFGVTQDAIGDLSEAWQQVAVDVLYPSIMANFDAEGRPVRWQSLSEAYRARKEAIWGPKPILQASELLLESMSGPDATPYNITIYEPQQLTIGLRADTGGRAGIFYALFHQSRGDRSSNLPRRPFLMIQAEDVEPIIQIVQAHIVRAWRTMGEVGFSPLVLEASELDRAWERRLMD